VIRKSTLVLALAAGLSLAACSTTSVRSDYDDLQDFSTYKTFSWADESPMTVFGDRRIPPTAEPKISRAIKAELESKGYTYVRNRQAADFAVSFSRALVRGRRRLKRRPISIPTVPIGAGGVAIIRRQFTRAIAPIRAVSRPLPRLRR